MSTSTFERLARSDEPTLDTLFAAAPGATFDALVGFEWRAYDTSAKVISFRPKKLIKAFFRAQHGDEGCDLTVFQNAFVDPWKPRTRRGRLDPFAFSVVRPQSGATRLEDNPRTLVVDYAASPRNPIYRMERMVREYVVQPLAEEPDIMLGRAIAAIGSLRVASSFFVMQRGAPFTWPV